MHSKSYLVAAVAVTAAMSIPAQSDAQAQAQGRAAADTVYDPIRDMVGRLELEKYKATIKGLTQFGDRRQGTERNRKAVDWIEAQLKSYGCTNTERDHLSVGTAPATAGRPVDAAARRRPWWRCGVRAAADCAAFARAPGSIRIL